MRLSKKVLIIPAVFLAIVAAIAAALSAVRAERGERIAALQEA